MQQSSSSHFSRDQFMALFNDHATLNQLSTEDKLSIASKLIIKDQQAFWHYMERMMYKRDISMQQLLDERNSLPVF